MKKLELEVYFDGSSIQIVNEPHVIEQMKSTFKPGYLDAIFKDAFQWKSNQQMGHFFGNIASIIHSLLCESGYRFGDKLESVKYIMENYPSESGVGASNKWCEVGYDRDGMVVSRRAMSIAGMSKSELQELAYDLILFLNNLGVEVPDVDSYKKSKK